MSVTAESPLVWVCAAFSVVCAEGTAQPCGFSSERVLGQEQRRPQPRNLLC